MWSMTSLVLGLTAWGLPMTLGYFADRGGPIMGWGVSIGSMSCCILALYAQLLEVQRRTVLEDWSALMDTMRAVVMAGGVLILVTVLLNVGMWLALRSEQKNRGMR